jgi:mycobactin lysine-N-oxygenase
VERKRLAIIGGGPKGVAIAAKAHVLRILGKIDIEVSIFEEHGIAANWDGTNGYTDGNQRLGTPPEKDIGYPYRCVFGEDASLELYEYSWASYLVANRWFGRYVDRGKPHPNHSEWAGYL